MYDKWQKGKEDYMAKLQMKSGFTRKLKLPLILTLAHSVMKQLGLVEYINENVPWDPSHWEMSPGDLAQLLVLSTFTDIRTPLTHLEDRFEGIDVSFFLGSASKSATVNYHNHSEEISVKIDTVLKDAATLKELCGSDYDDSSSYQLLLRVLKEQAVQKEDGTYRLRIKEYGGMDASILQNPADPDATYREKAGKQHRGYVANVIEASGKNGSIIGDY